jgi:hypothetical protein
VKTRRQLAYKTRWNGGRLAAADRWFPSSKTCSDLPGSETHTAQSTRALHCEQLWPVIDRDRNAAINLKHQVTQSGWQTINGRGADQKTKPSLAGGSYVHPAPRIGQGPPTGNGELQAEAYPCHPLATAR